MADRSEFQLLPNQQKSLLTIRSHQRSLSFILAIAFGVLVGAAYLGLRIYRSSIVRQIAIIDEELQKVESNRNREIESTLLGFNDKLTTLAKIMAQQSFWSQGLRKFSTMIDPKIRFDSLSVDSDKRTYTFKATADSYETIAKQLAVFYASPDILDVLFTGATKDQKTGKVQFDLVVTFKSGTFIYTAQK